LILQGSELAFPHPIFSAFLAAEHAVDFRELPPRTDDDIAAFIAALAAEDPAMARLALGEATIFAIARYARLGNTIEIATGRPDGVARMDAMIRRLAPKTAGGLPTPCHLVVLDTDGYLCVAVRRDELAPELLSDITFPQCLDHFGDPAMTFTCWKEDAFARLSPETLAAFVVTSAFKKAWRELRPAGARFAAPGADISALIADPNLEARALEFTQEVRYARTALLDRLDLRGSLLEVTAGEPSVRLHINGNHAVMEVEWGGTEPKAIRDDDRDGLGSSMSRLLADPSAVAYAELEDDIEAGLGSLVFSQAGRRPIEPWSL
jgi:hypothetical protein